jgi:hypothetical protein
MKNPQQKIESLTEALIDKGFDPTQARQEAAKKVMRRYKMDKEREAAKKQADHRDET